MNRQKYIVAISFIVLAAIASGSAFARLTSDKTPNEGIINSRKADIAIINNEALLKQLLVEAKKTNELLAKIAGQSAAEKK